MKLVNKSSHKNLLKITGRGQTPIKEFSLVIRNYFFITAN
jgi:hypothetical protein